MAVTEPVMPFRRVFRTNKQALDWLLSREEKGLPPAPSAVLLDWIATIPAAAVRARAKRALIRRFGLPNAPHPTNVQHRNYRFWREMPFKPSVWLTDENTHRRVEIRYDKARRLGLLNTMPQQWRSMTIDQVMSWMKSENESIKIFGQDYWVDSENREYDIINGTLVLRK